LPVPPSVWPGPGRPDQGLPGQPPGIWGGAPGQPGVSHPITPAGYVWVWSPDYGWIMLPIGGVGSPPHPDQGLPGAQPHPDQGLPSDQPKPDQSLPEEPPHATPH
jgi:hypothetical protein